MKIIRPLLLFCPALYLLPSIAMAQSASAQDANKTVRVVRVESAPVIDGKLDDAVWQHAEVMTEFHQIRPGNGTEPSDPTEVVGGLPLRELHPLDSSRVGISQNISLQLGQPDSKPEPHLNFTVLE